MADGAGSEERAGSVALEMKSGGGELGSRLRWRRWEEEEAARGWGRGDQGGRQGASGVAAVKGGGREARVWLSGGGEGSGTEARRGSGFRAVAEQAAG